LAIAAASPLPDIVMQLASELSPTIFTADYAIRNAAVTGPLQFNVYQSPTPPPASAPFAPGPNDVLVGSPTLPASDTADLAMGEHDITLSLSSPRQLDPSHPYVIVLANPGGVIPESDSANDTNDAAAFRTYIVGVDTHGFEFPFAGPPAWVGQMASALQQKGYDAVLPFDWSLISGLPAPGMTQLAGLSMAFSIISLVGTMTPTPRPNDVVDLQLIGHSRGAVVISQAALDLQFFEQLGLTPGLGEIARGYLKMTFLDPHPSTPHFPPIQEYSASPTIEGFLLGLLYQYFESKTVDPAVVVPSNADQAEVYYQQTNYADAPAGLEQTFNLWGEVPISNLSGSAVQYHFLNLQNAPTANGHGEVPTWYLNNVILASSSQASALADSRTSTPSATAHQRGRRGLPSAFRHMARRVIAFERRIVDGTIGNRPRVADAFVRDSNPLGSAMERRRVFTAALRLSELNEFANSQRGKHITSASGASLEGLAAVLAGLAKHN
jgi:hypothetical protein